MKRLFALFFCCSVYYGYALSIVQDKNFDFIQHHFISSAALLHKRVQYFKEPIFQSYSPWGILQTDTHYLLPNTPKNDDLIVAIELAAFVTRWMTFYASVDTKLDAYPDPLPYHCNILLGNLSKFPVYLQVGCIRFPFSSNISALLPPSEISAHRLLSHSSSFKDEVNLSSLVGTDFTIAKHHRLTGAFFYGVFSTPMNAPTRNLLGGAAQYIGKSLYGLLKIGGAYHFYDDKTVRNYPKSEITFLSKNNFFINFQRGRLQIGAEYAKIPFYQEYSWHSEIAFHFKPYRFPTALVFVHESSHVEQSQTSHIILGVNIKPVTPVRVMAGIRINTISKTDRKAYGGSSEPYSFMVNLRLSL